MQMQMQMQQQAADVVVPPLATEPPLKVLLMVEPTPFNYVSGYANRFKEMLKFLKQAGDDVHVLTADKDPQPPTEYLNYPISTNRGFEWPLYKHVTLSFDFSMKTKQIIEDFKPDLIHVSSPSCVMWPAIIWARLYDLPLVISYHTDFVKYSKTYGGWPGAGWTAYHVVRLFHNRADLTLCTSPQVRTRTRTQVCLLFRALTHCPPPTMTAVAGRFGAGGRRPPRGRVAKGNQRRGEQPIVCQDSPVLLTLTLCNPPPPPPSCQAFFAVVSGQ
jgi:glycosyltransferase involved in cell wall biosynthesis